jgi:hypothetical protein
MIGKMLQSYHEYVWKTLPKSVAFPQEIMREFPFTVFSGE